MDKFSNELLKSINQTLRIKQLNLEEFQILIP